MILLLLPFYRTSFKTELLIFGFISGLLVGLSICLGDLQGEFRPDVIAKLGGFGYGRLALVLCYYCGDLDFENAEKVELVAAC